MRNQQLSSLIRVGWHEVAITLSIRMGSEQVLVLGESLWAIVTVVQYGTAKNNTIKLEIEPISR